MYIKGNKIVGDGYEDIYEEKKSELLTVMALHGQYIMATYGVFGWAVAFVKADVSCASWESCYRLDHGHLGYVWLRCTFCKSCCEKVVLAL